MDDLHRFLAAWWKKAKANEIRKSTKTKTWKFKAENVRDFAFASSRKFIWDAQAVQLPSNKVMAMSFYPKEGLPTWSEESTKAIKNALEIYSEATFDYPLSSSYLCKYFQYWYGVSND